jgi:hypothetical protein
MDNFMVEIDVGSPGWRLFHEAFMKAKPVFVDRYPFAMSGMFLVVDAKLIGATNRTGMRMVTEFTLIPDSTDDPMLHTPGAINL